MNLIESVKTCFQKIITFSGRASRSEFWWFMLLLFVISTIIQSIAGTDTGTGRISFKFGINFELGPQVSIWENLFTIIFFVPFVSVLVRRLHDTNRSGYKALLGLGAVFAVILAAFAAEHFEIIALFVIFTLLAIALLIYFIVIFAKKSDPHDNKYGPNPLEVSA